MDHPYVIVGFIEFMQVKSFRFHTAVRDEEINEFISGKTIHDIKLSSVSWIQGSNHYVEHTVLILYD